MNDVHDVFGSFGGGKSVYKYLLFICLKHAIFSGKRKLIKNHYP